MEQHLLQAILDRYDLGGTETQLVGDLWNRVYRVKANNGHLYSLRLSPPAIHDKKSLEDELTWLELVASQNQVRVPNPVRNQQEDLITVIPTDAGERLSCLFDWVEGEPAKKNLTSSVMRQIGQTVARLHQIAREFGSSFQENDFRSGYRYDSSLVTSHQDWIEAHQAEIGVENSGLLHTATTWLIEELKHIGKTRDNFGIIHADLHLGNLLVQGKQVSVIDFDQLGWGHYGYDLAVLMVELFNEPGGYAERWEDFREGYQQIAVLPLQEDREISPFVVAVNLAFLDWVYNSPNPAVKEQMGQRLPATFESIRTRIGM